MDIFLKRFFPRWGNLIERSGLFPDKLLFYQNVPMFFKDFQVGIQVTVGKRKDSLEHHELRLSLIDQYGHDTETGTLVNHTIQRICYGKGFFHPRAILFSSFAYDIIRDIVTIPCIRDTIKVAISIKRDIGTLNSSLPFLRKKRWIKKAKIPEKLKISENTRPPNVPSNTNISPSSTKNRSGKWIKRKTEIPPGMPKSSHSFQYAESISWLINKTAFTK
jgi:hypothetical protein